MCTCLNILTNAHFKWHDCCTNNSLGHPFRLARATYHRRLAPHHNYAFCACLSQ